MTQPDKKQRKKTGPSAERVKIKGDWEKAIATALKKGRPKQGWPTIPNNSEHREK
jgi:hypothetical protein